MTRDNFTPLSVSVRKGFDEKVGLKPSIGAEDWENGRMDDRNMSIK